MALKKERKRDNTNMTASRIIHKASMAWEFISKKRSEASRSGKFYRVIKGFFLNYFIIIMILELACSLT